MAVVRKPASKYVPTIHDFIKDGKTATVKRMLIDGTDPNERAVLQETPLHVAARKGALNVVQMLVERGADVNAKDYRKFTPLHNAAGIASLPVVEYLLRHGANAKAQNAFKNTPLHECTSGEGDKKTMAARSAVSEKLIAAGAPVNAKDTVDRTPLWYAVSNGNVKLVALLLKHGANPNAKARGLQGSPIYVAQEEGNDEILEWLKKK